MKKVIILSLLSGLFLVGCGGNSSKKTESTTSKTSESSISQADKDIKTNIEIAINSLKKGFSATHNISFDEKTKSFILSPKDGLSETETLKKVADNPTEPKYEETLKNMASNFIDLSTTISSNIGKEYKIKLKYPGNDNRDIFIIQDGNISYPIIDEKKNKKSSSNENPSQSTDSENEIAANENINSQTENPEQQAINEEAERARVQAQVDAENARIKAEEEASNAAIQAQFEEDQRKADEFNAKLQADWEAENQRLAEQDKANGY